MVTREEAKRRAELYSALAEGKTIQVQDPKNGTWTDMVIDCVECFPESFNYRIKDPKYRPFKDKKECWLEMHKHPDFGWGLNNIGEYVNLSRIVNEGIYFIKGDGFDFSKALKGFRFTDGTPFGIREDWLWK